MTSKINPNGYSNRSNAMRAIKTHGLPGFTYKITADADGKFYVAIDAAVPVAEPETNLGGDNRTAEQVKADEMNAAIDAAAAATAEAAKNKRSQVPSRKAESAQLKKDRKAQEAAAKKAARDATKPPKAPKKTSNPKPANIRHSSEIERPVKRVWHVADSMPNASRADVLAACEKLGIAYYTARTQYQLWKALNKSTAKK